MIKIIGAGLAGSEAAWQLAQRGHKIALYEMRPEKYTGAHKTDGFAEVVCSNSFGADDLSSPAGILKMELRLMRSLILECADRSKVPAGKALAIDRELFSSLVTEKISNHPNIEIFRQEITDISELTAGTTIIATGPLTSMPLAESLKCALGEGYFSFFDAIAPIVMTDSIDMNVVWRGGRYGRGDDYLNCPMNKEQYLSFIDSLLTAERAVPHDFERDCSFFEGCMPVEQVARRGVETLRFGAMRPVGLPDPRTGHEPYSVVQLRQDNSDGTMFNLVGFQTSLKFGEQARVFRMIPGLENAEFARFGVMHRNIYVNAPGVLDAQLRLKNAPQIFIAGQLTGVEGYMESTAMGIAAAINAHCVLSGRDFLVFPRESAMGSLLHYLGTSDIKNFQPMNVNLGIFPPLEGKKIKKKQERCEAVAARAIAKFEAALNGLA